MDELERNNRQLATATVLMVVIVAALVTVMMLFFPLTAYTNPNAGIIPGLINSPQGNIMSIVFLGLMAAVMGAFLNRVIALERQRNAILARNAQAAAAAKPVRSAPQAGATLPPPEDDEPAQ
jgi:hypothetical protein